MSRRGPNRGFRRTFVTGGLALGALFGTMASPGQAAPGSAKAPAQDAPFIDQGRASGRGNVISVAPTAGSLQFALGSGEVMAETSRGLAQASATAADLGIIGSTLTQEKCDGSDPTLTPDQLPQALVVDNRGGAKSATEDEAPAPIPGTAGGHKEVEATTTPSSRASVTSVDVELPGLLSVNGGEAVAEAEVFPGAGREARSTVDVDVDLAGAIQLRGLHWEVRHRTGGEDAAEGSFSVDALQVLGVPVPTEDLGAAEAAVNQGLAAVGLRIEMPEVVRVNENGVDFIRVTPLRLVLAESPIGELVVRPTLEASQQFRNELYTVAEQITCQAVALLLVGELGIGILAGTGQLIASIGGVEASSSNIIVEDLFGNFGGGVGPVLGPTPDVGSGAIGGGAGVPTAALPAASPSAGAGPGSAASSPTRDTGPFDRVCESIHPNRKPSCSDGAAGVVGVVGLGATAAVGALDLHRRRRALVAAAGGAS